MIKDCRIYNEKFPCHELIDQLNFAIKFETKYPDQLIPISYNDVLIVTISLILLKYQLV